MSKHIHILGICGTFMGSLAILAREKGFKVTGSDKAVYPPMSTYLQKQGIKIYQGYEPEVLELKPDHIIIGNTMRRGMAIIEKILDDNLSYSSGPKWLYEHILKDKFMIAIAGTHGKTTTTSLVCKMLDDAGFNPGFLIGGVTQDFGVSSRLTDSKYFVIEADEYDTAFFDKRSKFMHYHPDVLLINNLEFDHADIFENLDAILKQFHYLIRTLPAKTAIIYPEEVDAIERLLEMGVWSKLLPSGKEKGTYVKAKKRDYSEFVIERKTDALSIKWPLIGAHNAQNALHAYMIGKLLEIPDDGIQQSFFEFKGVKRRLECIFHNETLSIYDDFAHHPTAVKETLLAVRAKSQRQGQSSDRVIAILEPRSNTMKMGVHKKELIDVLQYADEAWLYMNENALWKVDESSQSIGIYQRVCDIVEAFEKEIVKAQSNHTHFVIMSNGGFEGLHKKLCDRASEKA